jgi:hypothetical protein
VVIINGGSVVIISGDNSTIHLNTLALLSELFSKDFFNIHFTNLLKINEKNNGPSTSSYYFSRTYLWQCCMF